MVIAISVLAVAFVAVSVWLVVRIVNRHERWAKWTLAALIGVPALYVGSFGPACWISDRDLLSENFVIAVYRPLVTLCISTESSPLRSAVVWWGQLLPTPQPQTGEARWSTVEDAFYAALTRRALERSAESE
jgi:hypothetical protein